MKSVCGQNRDGKMLKEKENTSELLVTQLVDKMDWNLEEPKMEK